MPTFTPYHWVVRLKSTFTLLSDKRGEGEFLNSSFKEIIRPFASFEMVQTSLILLKSDALGENKNRFSYNSLNLMKGN